MRFFLIFLIVCAPTLWLEKGDYRHFTKCFTGHIRNFVDTRINKRNISSDGKYTVNHTKRSGHQYIFSKKIIMACLLLVNCTHGQILVQEGGLHVTHKF